jgi:menaquinone-dependent protoporphyrinogen oxidase
MEGCPQAEKEGPANMDRKILVAYASKYGATAEIAEKIGAGLRQAGLETDVLPAQKVNDLAPYQAVILGSAVYMGRWRKEALQFLKNHMQALAGRPVWVFSSGPTGEGDPLTLVDGWRYPEGQQPLIESIHPRDLAVFHGKMDPQKLNLFEKQILKMVKAKIGDFRDWESIAAWAASIAEVLKNEGAAAGS